ncbi:MAG: permease [Gammaproteobacteria bacterium]
MLADFHQALWSVLLDLSPALLAGLFLAGLLHVFLPQGLIHRALSRPGLGSVWRAVLVGVPMPLCSCGVVPTALGLRKDGASKGATTAFLISTPQTGVDSVLVSASFLGWPFALFKVAAAAITGIIGGLIGDKIDAGEIKEPPALKSREDKHAGHRLVEAIDYGIHDLFGVIDRWIVFGVLVAAAITAATPPDFFAQTSWTQGLTGMLIMLAIALPLYVCATGSVPIAASFVAAGMPAGTALVFLMAGPATNMATIGAIYRSLGGRIVAVYLGTVIVMSIGLGLTFDFILPSASTVDMHHHGGTDWIATVSAVLVIGLWLYLEFRRLRRRVAASTPEDSDVDMTLNVDGMTCPHCVASVKRTLEDLDGVDSATPDLDSGTVALTGEVLDTAALRAAIEGAGYRVKD